MKITEEKFARITRIIIKDVIDALPRSLRSKTDNLIFEIMDKPGPDRITEDDDISGLMGLYSGVPLNERGVFENYTGPDVITLFRLNIAEQCENERELRDEIKLTIIHELGHMFGLEEDDLERMGLD